MRETGTTHNLEWRLQCELLRTDMRSSRGRVRCPVRTSITRCCGRAGPDGDKHLDGRKLRTGNLETRRRKWTLSRYRRKWKQDECKYWTSTGPSWITGCFLFFSLKSRRTLSWYRRNWKQDECKYWTSIGPTRITGRCFLFFR